MIALLQRVSEASVTVDAAVVGAIGKGLLVYLGVVEGDTERAVDALAEKIVHFRIYPDDAGRFDRSLTDVGGEILLVSQFTLAGSWRKGRRPGF
ncbi:MAG: D-tyrosyl-tRNA(Tyr) deacylase, partial [Nitrospinae bacterium]|nr:D-tyrosyl-tRNA(Tyr) deacylase [Nitrospinota bacterium]